MTPDAPPDPTAAITAAAAMPPSSADAPPPTWRAERESLFEMLAHQQRVAQVGLIASGLAHDVMNQIQGISGAAQLALMRGDPAAATEGLELVVTRCRDVSETTRALLQFVRRRDAAAEGEFAVNGTINTAARLISPLSRANGVRVSARFEGSPRARGDAQLLVQALVNLASNAVHACAATHGSVELAAVELVDGRTRIDVIDTGPGVPEAIRARMFRPFETGHANSGGNGLGLFIVRQAVRRLAGSIRVRTSSRGTRFTIELPALPAPGTIASNVCGLPSSLASRRTPS